MCAILIRKMDGTKKTEGKTMEKKNDNVIGTAEKAIEMTIAKKMNWLHKRAERAMTLSTPEFVGKYVAFVESGYEGREGKVYYKVNVRPGHEACTCEDWIYRGKPNGIPCKHMLRVMGERMVRDEENARVKETAEIMAEADEAVKRSELPLHAPEHVVN